jgi:hypothetical protein
MPPSAAQYICLSKTDGTHCTAIDLACDSSDPGIQMDTAELMTTLDSFRDDPDLNDTTYVQLRTTHPHAAELFRPGVCSLMIPADAKYIDVA